MWSEVLYQVIADGIAWIDSDGTSAWDRIAADNIADALESLGYDVSVVPA